jgi:hypothetical protein
MTFASSQGLAVGVAIWPRDAQAAACLMIDDLTDGWIDVGGGARIGGADWGHACDGAGSSFRFLCDGLLREFPEIRTTFFVPVDRLPDVAASRNTPHFQRIDARPEFVAFLRALDADERFECAYHGKEHGKPGPRSEDYEPEFTLYASVEDALAGIERGREIWRRVFGRDPAGGKYPAYASGAHGDAAIDRAGFTWWCRRFDPEVAGNGDAVAFEPRFFGEAGVVDVPSTVHGGLATLIRPASLHPRRVAGALRHDWRALRNVRPTLAALLERRSVISVQEHITWSRPDAGRLVPNVYDDAASLRRIFAELRRHRVWHATCGDIARYFEARSRTTVSAVGAHRFRVSYAGRQDGDVRLSLALSGIALPDEFGVRGPRGEVRVRVAHRTGRLAATTDPIPLASGCYEIAS